MVGTARSGRATGETAGSGRATGRATDATGERKKAGDPGDRQPSNCFSEIECVLDERSFDLWQISSRNRWKRRNHRIRWTLRIRWKLHNHHQR